MKTFSKAFSAKTAAHYEMRNELIARGQINGGYTRCCPRSRNAKNAKPGELLAGVVCKGVRL
jgi:hypothetical protein